jgi:hypothetical protein
LTSARKQDAFGRLGGGDSRYAHLNPIGGQFKETRAKV